MRKKRKLLNQTKGLHHYQNNEPAERAPFPNLKWIMGIVVTLGISLGMFRLVSHLSTHSQMFALKEIRVEGNRLVDRQEILRLANLKIGMNLYQIPTRQISGRILKNHYIQGVSLARSLPSTMIISVQERVPVAYLVDQQVYMIDEYGVILPNKAGITVSHLPLITGLTVNSLLKDRRPLFEALNLISRMREVDNDLFQFISEIHIDYKSPPCLYLIKGGTRVELGDDFVSQRLFILSSLVKDPAVYKELDRIKYIDLRFKDRVIVSRKS